VRGPEFPIRKAAIRDSGGFFTPANLGHSVFLQDFLSSLGKMAGPVRTTSVPPSLTGAQSKFLHRVRICSQWFAKACEAGLGCLPEYKRPFGFFDHPTNLSVAYEERESPCFPRKAGQSLKTTQTLRPLAPRKNRQLTRAQVWFAAGVQPPVFSRHANAHPA